MKGRRKEDYNVVKEKGRGFYDWEGEKVLMMKEEEGERKKKGRRREKEEETMFLIFQFVLFSFSA